jgi:hypothetical protein
MNCWIPERSPALQEFCLVPVVPVAKLARDFGLVVDALGMIAPERDRQRRNQLGVIVERHVRPRVEHRGGRNGVGYGEPEAVEKVKPERPAATVAFRDQPDAGRALALTAMSASHSSR